jgi:putative hydrolase of the HAD superfamily
MKIKAIIFDLDDTLFGTEVCYTNALKKVGINADNADFEMSRNKVRERVGPDHVSYRNRILYFKEYLSDRKEFSSTLVLRMMDEYEAELKNQVSAQWKSSGHVEVLRELKKMGFRLVVMTNENMRTQMTKVSAIDPHGDFFENVITSEECGVGKPSPKIFKTAFDSLNLRPQDCAMVGDSLICDIQPALQYSMPAIHTSEFVKVDEKTPDAAIKIQSLKEIVLIAKKWL